uniref:Uncharacterized protein n=1 Tax=Panagrolaimus sp. ES5 TaxID=591445 RepID=A0AC34GIX2_9BILA
GKHYFNCFIEEKVSVIMTMMSTL